MYCAVEKNRINVVKLLLKYNVDLNNNHYKNITPLKLAIYRNYNPIVEVLLKYKNQKSTLKKEKNK